ncbi:hypothetical protein, partial [Spongiactinospora gelatinilytica]|uniref:hypothetical protein n=1 Tax=Spongiactinospora gelatinilytica TaxID=2666298 RepID=UPI001F22D6D1
GLTGGLSRCRGPRAVVAGGPFGEALGPPGAAVGALPNPKGMGIHKISLLQLLHAICQDPQKTSPHGTDLSRPLVVDACGLVKWDRKQQIRPS